MIFVHRDTIFPDVLSNVIQSLQHDTEDTKPSRGGFCAALMQGKLCCKLLLNFHLFAKFRCFDCAMNDDLDHRLNYAEANYSVLSFFCNFLFKMISNIKICQDLDISPVNLTELLR